MHDVLVNLALTTLDVFLLQLLGARAPPRVRRLMLLAGAFAILVALTLSQRGIFGVARLLAFGLFAHLPLVLASTALLLRRRAPYLAIAGAACSLLVVFIAIDAFILEPSALDITHFTVESTKVDHAIRIVVISDIQFEDFGDHERRALEAAMAQRPDLVLFTGDYVQSRNWARHTDAITAMNAELRALHFGAPLGAYAVGGNVDASDWSNIFARTDVSAFARTTDVALPGVSLTALDLEDSFDTHRPIKGAPGFHIVFGHGPDYALADVDADLLVAGHTHGGQVQLPWIGPLVTLAQVPRRSASGMSQLGGRTLVVSRGIGMERGEAPRLRFLCRPEIVVIDVVKKA